MGLLFMALPSLRQQARLFKLLALALLFPGTAPQLHAQPQPPTRAADQRPSPAEALHRVAVLAPLSGSSALIGQSIVNAANLAHADTGGQRIRITAYDTARGAAAAASRALAEGNGLILGPLLAEDVRAVAPIAARAGRR
jgi:outer membrane PBP1 activator LpoA protein